MIILLFYIGFFLSWIVTFKIKKARQFRNSLLFRFFARIKNWFVHKIKLYENSKGLKNTNREVKKEHFPILDFNDISEKKIILTIEPEDPIIKSDVISISDSIDENNDELLNISLIEQENNVTVTTKEAFIMPLLTNLNQIKKKNSPTKKTNQISIIFIDKEAKEIQALKNKELGDLGEEYVMEYESRLFFKLKH